MKAVDNLLAAARENNIMNDAKWADWSATVDNDGVSHLCDIYETELSDEERQEAEIAYKILVELEEREGTWAANRLSREWA